MLLLLGGTGFIGSAFIEELTKRSIKFVNLSRYTWDYTKPEDLNAAILHYKPEFIINAAGYTGKPNVDACETDKAACLIGNVVFPAILANACKLHGIPFGHISTGCVYDGHPDHGYSEDDPPNFCFSSPRCSFYSGTKALAEEILKDHQCYIWRLRMPFDHIPHPKNYLTKLMAYEKLYNNTNSLSHRGQCVAACVDLWQKGCPFGIYNVVNPGAMTTVLAASFLSQLTDRSFKFFKTDREFYEVAKTPRSNCVLNTDKISSYGIYIPDIFESMLESASAYAYGLKNPKAA